MRPKDYVIRVLSCILDLPAQQWNALLARQSRPNPFMRHEYLAALQTSGCASSTSGWRPQLLTLWRADPNAGADELIAACPLYLKTHSYGEYVFDWAWANAYAQHGLAYYPKAVVAVPFTPVPGSRLLARDSASRQALIEALLAWCQQQGLSSLHLLFASDDDLASCAQAGMLLRQTVQFHWTNQDFRSFDDFLGSLSQIKRKKINQERRKVREAGVIFRCASGHGISNADWDFFYRCYEKTYLEHGNQPYLNRDFFSRLASSMADNCLLFVAEQQSNGSVQALAASLIILGEENGQKVAYGRYWGALQRVDCLHFEACYYQPLQWCIEHGIARFEGGAQGEHKMARALLPVTTSSAHWLAHPDFSDAVERFLQREGQGVANYMEDLSKRSPIRKTS
ncbi:MAG: GNAT family N-acetyltransferase [Burkholderiaceae bacterium]